MNISQPDVTLLLDSAGVIKEVTLSDRLSSESIDAWIGQRWANTVADIDIGQYKVDRMLQDTHSHRVSTFRQLTQRFPSGLELLMEYTTVRLGGNAGLLAIGKNLQAVAELQSRLINAQQTMERDYWKLREIETRYRLLFDASNEAVLLVKAADLSIIDANPAAIRALGISPVGQELLSQLGLQEQKSFAAMLGRVREQGKAPGVLVHLGHNQQSWMIRASLMTASPGPIFLLQLTPIENIQDHFQLNQSYLTEELIKHAPDGFVVLDDKGIILQTNQAFLNLIQIASNTLALGQPLSRWLRRPGADLKVLLANVQQHQSVRLFNTILQGELGLDSEVELSAVAHSDANSFHIGVFVRDVGRRLHHHPGESNDHIALSLNSFSEQLGKTSLRELVKQTTRSVEKHYIDAALKLTAGNRTATAELLGLSRQSLHSKLIQYQLHEKSYNNPE